MAFPPMALAPLLGIGEKVIDKIWPDPETAAKAKIEMAKSSPTLTSKQIKDFETSSQLTRVEGIRFTLLFKFFVGVCVPFLLIALLVFSFMVLLIRALWMQLLLTCCGS